jgi:hypothetical protein
MYTHTNFKTKKAMFEAVNAGESVTVYQPGPFGDDRPINGTVTLEGPHYPQPHRWYARVQVVDSVITEVLK